MEVQEDVVGVVVGLGAETKKGEVLEVEMMMISMRADGRKNEEAEGVEIETSVGARMKVAGEVGGLRLLNGMRKGRMTDILGEKMTTTVMLIMLPINAAGEGMEEEGAEEIRATGMVGLVGTSRDSRRSTIS